MYYGFFFAVLWMIIGAMLYRQSKLNSAKKMKEFSARMTDEVLSLQPDQEARKEWMQETFGEEKERISIGDAMALAKRAQGQAEIQKLFIAEMSFYAEWGYYTASLESLRVFLNPGPYEISIDSDSISFVIRAEGNIDSDNFSDIILMGEEGGFYFEEDDIRNERNPVD